MCACALLPNRAPAMCGSVEGAEYELMPWLLLHGAICRLRYLHQEWHLSKAPIERRLAGLSMRVALHTLLEQGCAEPPVAIFHDAATQNNVALAIPGLRELAAFNAAWARQPHETLSTVARDEAQVAALLAADGIPSNASRAARCSRLAAAPPSRQELPGAKRAAPRCEGACPTERLLQDANFTAESYRRAKKDGTTRDAVMNSVPCFPSNSVGING